MSTFQRDSAPIMPTYDYECDACGNKFEEFQTISADPLTKCPKCKKKKLRRLFGAGAAVVFKGSGFYTTDYRSDSYRKSAASDKTSSDGGSTSSDSKSGESKAGDSKPAESKPAAEAPAPTKKDGGSKGKRGKDA